MREFPKNVTVERVRRITDRYIDGTTLRLREVREGDGPAIYKLTQKIAKPADGAQQGLITNMYLTAGDFSVLAQLPAATLCKTRYSGPPFGIDRFEGELQGLLLAEAEFNSATDACALALPSFIVREVTSDLRFTGGELVRTSRQKLASFLLEYGIELSIAGESRCP